MLINNNEMFLWRHQRQTHHTVRNKCLTEDMFRRLGNVLDIVESREDAPAFLRPIAKRLPWECEHVQ